MHDNINSRNTEEGIDLKDLLKLIRTKFRIVIISMTIFLILAIIIVLFTPKVYKTQIRLLAESSSNSPSSNILGQLGGLSGVNMGSLMGLDFGGGTGSDVLTPDLYPEIVKSTTFLIEILEQKIIEPKTNKEITVAQYFTDYTKPNILGISGYLLAKIKTKKNEDLVFNQIENQPLKLTQKQSDLLKSFSDLIEVNVIKSGGGLTGGDSKIINVSVEVQNPTISAVMAQMVVENLKQYIINYNTGKAKNDLVFIEARYVESQEKYYRTQTALADFYDSNINVISASLGTKRQRLETENSLASNLYNSLALKLEQSKILVQDKTPVFTVIEPAKVPIRKSKPKSSLILLSMLFIGGFVGVTIILSKELLQSLRK